MVSEAPVSALITREGHWGTQACFIHLPYHLASWIIHTRPPFGGKPDSIIWFNKHSSFSVKNCYNFLSSSSSSNPAHSHLTKIQIYILRATKKAIIFLLFFSLLSSSLVAADTIISDGRTLVSPGGAFELGFFNLPDSSSRYVGIWYKLIPGLTVVWIANRDKPITGSSGVLDLTAAGNLTVLNGADVLWSTNTAGLTNPVLHLLDSGNLVLTSDQSNEVAWQSFDHPTDTLLPGMKIGWDLRSNRERRLTSWKTTSDPSPGPYSLGLTLHPAADIYVWNGSAPAARIGPWDGVSWGGAPRSDLTGPSAMITSTTRTNPTIRTR